MRVCHRILPFVASNATKLPLPSPVKSTPPGGRQHAGAAAAAGVLVLPGRLAGPVVDRRQEVVEPADADAQLAAEPHRPARIGIGQVEHVEAVLLVHVEQPGVRGERRRLPVGDAALDRRDERARDMIASFSGFGLGRSVRARARVAQLA